MDSVVSSSIPSSTLIQEIAPTPSTSREGGDDQAPLVQLKLAKPKKRKKVTWGSETVDNELLGKKSSKCCCIWDKPKEFGESSDEEDDDDECKNCYGHKQRK
uniref:E3 ubiquitin-protein ligase PPP1R11 n=1 Tax=Tetranychus urticae TaxID=32264 RepID=T1KW21_TETUR